MLLRDWRVGYTQSFDTDVSAEVWSWIPHASLAKAETKFDMYQESHYNKQKMAAMMLLLIEWDAETGFSSIITLRHLQYKLTPTIHYNKKDVSNKSDVVEETPQWINTYMNTASPTAVSETLAPSNSQLLNAFITHLHPVNNDN